MSVYHFKEGTRGAPYEGTVPGLEGRVHPDHPPYDLKIPDNQRVDVWLQEFRRFEEAGELPRLSILRLGGDHTAGTRPGYPTPRAMVRGAGVRVRAGDLLLFSGSGRFRKLP